MRSLGFFRSPTKLLIAAWVIYLVYLSSIPRLLLAPSLPRPLVSPTAHVVAYFILATLIYMVLTRRRPGPIGGLKSAIRAMAIATAVGITVEVMQSFPPEGSVQLSDVVFNVAGTIAGLLVVLFLSVIGVPRRLIFAAIGTGMALVIVVFDSRTCRAYPAEFTAMGRSLSTYTQAMRQKRGRTPR